MLHTVTRRSLALAACAWLLAGDAAALTLGRARAAALIGRPLEVVVPVTLDAPDTEAPCASADLYYGDSRIEPPTVRWEARGGAEGVLRVTSPVLVDEPMVTLYLRVGCGQSSTRRYVLLSELPPENEPQRAVPFAVQPPVAGAPATTAPGARAGTPSAARPSVAPPAAGAPSASGLRRRDAVAAAPVAPREDAAAAAPVARAERPARAQATERASARITAPAPVPRALRTPPARSQARLKLEPLDLTEDRDPVLRLSSELRTQLATDPRQRDAAAALWQAVQKTPDQALQEAVRLQALERDFNALRTATRENVAVLRQMRSQVDRAQGGRQTAVLLVLGLVLVLVALLSWFAWRWHRARQLENVGRWFEANGEAAQVPPVAPVAPVPAPEPTLPRASKKSAVAAALGAAAAGAHTVRSSSAPAASAHREFAASRGGTMRIVGVEELIDVHEKAGFFLSIGETEQAIAVLESHVHDQVDTSALAWMDLLDLYHAHGRRVEYERLRAEFQQRFTVQVPDFEHFDQPTATLENYGRALSRIVALWPSPKVLDVIEESIFRKPGLPGAEPFSLEAYRELVLLYHIIQDLSQPPEEASDPGPTTTGFPQTSLQPLHALVERTEPAPADRERDRERLMTPPASARLGVDIDLGELPREDAGETGRQGEEEDETRQPDAGEPQPSRGAALDFDFSAYDDIDAAKPARNRG